MLKIYFAGKFNLLPKGETLLQRLSNDFRSILLGDSKRLTYADENAVLKNYPIRFSGPFYCEQASNGDYTSNDCEVVVEKETKAISDADIFCCVFDLNFSTGSIVELIDAAHAKKRIAVFYKNESCDYSIKSEYWFAITRVMQICNTNGTKFEVFSYDGSVLPVLYNWLTNLIFCKRYVSTRLSTLNTYTEKCIIINEYIYSDKRAYHYKDFNNNIQFVVEKYNNGLIIVKTSELLDVKGLIDVTTNPLYLDKNIKAVMISRAIIEGTDGTGKSTTISKLIEQGIVCMDRSELICQYMLFDITMETRVSAYREYLEEISPNYVIFLTNNSKSELERRINSRPTTTISDFDKLAYEYNTLYIDTYKEMIKLEIDNPIELVDCTGLSLEKQVNQVKECILRREKHE